jgi:hypothetical protein
VATNRLPTVCTSEECARSRIALNLVGQKDSDVELCIMSVIFHKTR